MNLADCWLRLIKTHIDQLMLSSQIDPDVSLQDWQHLQAQYKTIFGTTYRLERE